MSTDTIDFQMNFEDAQQAEADKKLFVVFYREAIKNETKSVEAGRPIFDEVDLIKIMFPGQRDTVVARVNEHYKYRFAAQWDRYSRGMDQGSSGTPLSQLGWMSMAQIAEYKALNCHTIEQLVGMPDAVAQRFMGYHGIKQRAQQYLDMAKGLAPLTAMEEQLQKRDAQIAELEAKVATLLAAAPPKVTAKA
jgi:hypothetical protein